MACNIKLNGNTYSEKQFKNLLENGLLFHLLKRDVISLPINQGELNTENKLKEMFPENSEDMLKSIEKIFGVKGEQAKTTLELVKYFAKGYMDRNPGKTLEDYIQSNTFVKLSDLKSPLKDENLLFSGLEEFRFVDDMQFEDDDNRSSYTVYIENEDIGAIEITKKPNGVHYMSWVSRLKQEDENGVPLLTEDGKFVYKGEKGDGGKIFLKAYQNLLNKGVEVEVDTLQTEDGFNMMQSLVRQGYFEQVEETPNYQEQRKGKPFEFNNPPFKATEKLQPNKDSFLFQQTNNVKETLEKVIKGFELVPQQKAFNGAFSTKNGKATPLLATQINNFIKDTLGIDNVKFVYEKTYGTVNISYSLPQNLFTQESSISIIRENINYFDEPGFKKRNPNFNPEKYTNNIGKFGNSTMEELPEYLTPYLIDGEGQLLLFQKIQAAILLQEVNDIIYSLTNPNVTSLPHELTHKFEKELTSIERDFILESYNENQKRLTNEESNKKEWDRDVSEFFARGFEKYLYDGIAPNSALKELFEKFSKWLKDIYKGIMFSNIDIYLNENMKTLYSKMLGQEYENIIRKEVKSEQQKKLDEELKKLNSPIDITKPLIKDDLNPASITARIEVAFIRKEYDDIVASGELTIHELKQIAKSVGISEEKVFEVEERLTKEVVEPQPIVEVEIPKEVVEEETFTEGKEKLTDDSISKVKETLTTLFNTYLVQTVIRNFLKTTKGGKKLVQEYLKNIGQESVEKYVDVLFNERTYIRESDGKLIYENRATSEKTAKAALTKVVYNEASQILFNKATKDLDRFYDEYISGNKIEIDLLSKYSAASSAFLLKDVEVVKEEELTEEELSKNVEEYKQLVDNTKRKIETFRIRDGWNNERIDEEQKKHKKRIKNLVEYETKLQNYNERLDKITDVSVVKEFNLEEVRKKEKLEEVSKLKKQVEKLEQRETDNLIGKEVAIQDKLSKIESLEKEIGIQKPKVVVEEVKQYAEVRDIENIFVQKPQQKNFLTKEEFQVEEQKYNSILTISKFLAKKFPQIDFYLGYFEEDFKGKIEGNIVKINLRLATLDTPFHEVMHPFVVALRETNIELYGAFVGEIIDTDIYNEVLNDPNYKKLSEEEINDEVIVRTLSENAKSFINSDGTINKEEVTKSIKESPILARIFKWIISKFKELVGKSSYAKLFFGNSENYDSVDNDGDIIKKSIIENSEILNMSLRDMTALIFATNENKVIFEKAQMNSINKLMAYSKDTHIDATKYLKKLRKKLEQLIDTERKLGKADVARFEANQIKRILDNYDDVEALQEFLRYSIFGLEAATDLVSDVKEEFDKLQNGFEKVYETDKNSKNYGSFVYKKTSDKSLLSEEDINNLNKKLAEAIQLMSFYETTVGIYDFYETIKDKEDVELFNNIFTKFHSKKKQVKTIMYDLATEWLYPRASKVGDGMSKEDFRKKLQFSTQDISTPSYLAGAAINQRDSVIATVAAEVKDKLNTNHLKETQDNTEVRRLFSNFLKQTGLSNNKNKIKEYFKNNFLRKAKTYQIVSIDKEGNKEYGYIERYAFHEDFFYDEFDKDFRTVQEEYKKTYGDPKTEKQWKDFNDFKFNWISANTQEIESVQKPSNKYKNSKFETLKNDEYYMKLYNTYKEANVKYGERSLDYGVIPQIYNKKGILDKTIEKVKSLKEYLSTLKDKNALGKTQTIVEDSLNYLFDEDSYRKAVSQNLDGTYYHSVNAPFTHLIDTEDVDLSLNESVLMFSSGANTHSELRDIQANVENLRNLVNGNSYLGIEPRKITKLQKRINPKTGKLVPVFTTDGIPLTDEKQTKRLANVFNQFIDDVFYGKQEEESNVKIGNVNVNMNKVGSDLGFFTAMISLAGNIVAGVSNLTIGNIQSLGEAIGSKYYTPKDWAKAKFTYYKNMPNFIADFNRPVKSKITQLGVIYDAIQGEFRDKYGKNITGNILQKYFTKDTIFLISHGAEHEIQLTGFLSLMNATKVKLTNGNEVSLYDAYQVNEKGFYKIREDAIWTEKDNDIFTRTLHGVSKDLNGNYSAFDKGTIQRHWLGKLGMQYRKYLYPAWRSRFGSKRFDYEREEYLEGYYRKFGKKFIEDLFAFRFNTFKFLTNQKPYTQEEAYAARKTMFDVSIMLMTTVLGLAISNMEAPENDEDKKMRNRLLVTALNLRKDIAGYSFLAPSEGVKIITNPAASFRNVSNLLKVSQQLFIDVYNGEMETYSRKGVGYEVGDTKLGRQIEKLIPLINQLDRLQNPEEQLKYLELTNQK